MPKQQNSDQKQGTINLYDYDKIISRTFILMKKDLSENNVKLIKKFDRVLVNESLSDARRSKIHSTLLSLSRLLKKDWIEAEKDDIEELVFNFNKKFSKDGQETNTTSDHKKILKNFYRWLKFDSRDQKSVGDPNETKWIRIKKPRETLTADMLISENEKNELLKACGENLRDRAFVHTFSDLACRPGEILSRQIKHVRFDENGAVIVVDGKTGPRPIRVIECVPDLASYFDKHPCNSDPEAPLWIAIDGKKFAKSWTYHAMRKRLQRICDIAKINKRIWPNLFRHTGVTKTGMFLTESLQKKRYGWSSNSKMPGRYEHMMNSDVEEAIFRHYGISKYKENDIINKPKICKICEMSNSYDSKLCSKCGKPLDLQTALVKEEEQQRKTEQQDQKISKMEQKMQEMLIEMTLRRSDYTFFKAQMGIPTEVSLEQIDSKKQNKEPFTLSW